MTIVLEQYLLHSIASFKHVSLVVHCKLNHANHAIGGISLGMFFVLHGALKLPAQFLPKIPPRMVKGKPTENRKTKQTTHFSVCMNRFLYSTRIH